MLINGEWKENWQPVQASDGEGRFLRQQSGFRHQIHEKSANGFTPDSGRYHLYLAYICPWASRTLIALYLKGLQDHITIDFVHPVLSNQGWTFRTDFPGATGDQLGDRQFAHQLYTQADPHYSGRATVPILWDKQQQTIVNNESADIVRLLNSGFGDLASNEHDLYPTALAHDIDDINDRLYERFNNGVYRAGFATTQTAYEEAVNDVFESLDWLESRLRERQWLAGNQLTEADIRVFVTLVRFDLAYYGAFKCNLHPLSHYQHVLAYLQRMLRIPAFANSVRPDHIKAGYYSIKAINPTGIVPTGPNLAYFAEKNLR